MIKVKWRKLVVHAVEVGVAHGLRQAFKHTDHPTREMIADAVETEIWNALDKFLVVEDDALDEFLVVEDDEE